MIAAFSTLLAIGFSGSPLPAATYYVRVSGSDANNGLAASTALRTITKAASIVQSGDTVYVGGGIYTDAVTFDGVQQSTAPLTFIADTIGAFTGDPGPAIISNQTVAVVNCNNFEFHAFRFQGATNRFVTWKGSYKGRFKDCIFDGGSKPLLIKDGSVKFEDCRLTNFTTDAIYVDGLAVVTLTNSIVSGCQGEGIEIAKTARVVLDGTTIENNVGDGIKAARVATFIDDGIAATGGVTQRLVAGKFRIVASQGSFDGYDSSVGPYGVGNSGKNIDLYGNSMVSASSSVPVKGNVFYGPSGSASVPNLSGTSTRLSSDITMNPISLGDAATNNNNASIPLTVQNKNAFVSGNLVLGSSDTLNLPPGKYYFDQVSITGGATLRISGPTTIYVTNRITLTSGYIANQNRKPGDLKFLVTGSLVTLSGAGALEMAVYAPDARISLSGSTAVYGMLVANEILANNTGGIHLDTALTSYAAGVQGLISGGSTSAPPADWVVFTQGSIDVNNSTIQRNRRAVNIETAQPFTARTSSFVDNVEWGLCLNGSADLDTCTISDNDIGGLSLKACDDSGFKAKRLTIGNNPQYGIYLDDCRLTFDNVSLDQQTFTSGSDYIVASQGGSLTLDGVTISGGEIAGLYVAGGTLIVKNSTITGSGYGAGADHGTMTISNCVLSGNTTGLYSQQNTMVNVAGTTFSSNTALGAAISLTSTTGATTTFTGSTFSGNGSGIVFVDAANCTINLLDTLIDSNIDDGLRFENCNLTLNAAATTGLQLTNNYYGLNSFDSTLTLDGLTVSDNAAAAVYAVGGNLTVKNSTLSSFSDGIAVNNSGSVLIDNCNVSGITAGLNIDQNANVSVVGSTFSGSQYGLWATNNAVLVVATSTFTGNSSYGAYIGGNGSMLDCTIANNGSGLYFNGANVSDANLAGTDIYGNGSYGVYVYAGSLALASQATSGWSIDGNGYNIGSYQANLSLTNVSLTNATSYGVFAQYGNVNLQQSTIQSNSAGVWCFNADSFTIDRSRISGASDGTWAILNFDSGLVMQNSIVSRSQYGVYSYGTSKSTTIYNSTIADAMQYGLYVHDGDLSIVNTIISGTNGVYGLYRQSSANVTHTHNLVDGFATPFVNATADATEVLAPPLFVDAANGDVHLAKGSPAINAGADLSLSLSVDIEGNPRPSHRVFEIGAYEYVQDGGSLRVLEWKETR